MLGPVPPPYGGIAAVMDTILHSSLTEEYSFDIFERELMFPPGILRIHWQEYFSAQAFSTFFETTAG